VIRLHDMTPVVIVTRSVDATIRGAYFDLLHVYPGQMCDDVQNRPLQNPDAVE